tara:strand:- start:61278 stop:61670 length:393 start_codon:yes stop_codon:yes gene_type:complete
MKKIILSAAVLLFAITTIEVSATETMTPLNSIETVEVYNTNTFCSLVKKGDYNGVKKLIDSGADINKKSKGMTPLMYAAKYNKSEIATLLIESGAKLSTRSSKDKITALDYAKRSKAMDAFKVIREALIK